jgi:hypothetical protein
MKSSFVGCDGSATGIVVGLNGYKGGTAAFQAVAVQQGLKHIQVARLQSSGVHGVKHCVDSGKKSAQAKCRRHSSHENVFQLREVPMMIKHEVRTRLGAWQWSLLQQPACKRERSILSTCMTHVFTSQDIEETKKHDARDLEHAFDLLYEEQTPLHGWLPLSPNVSRSSRFQA